MELNAQSKGGKGSPLVAYFSWGGNTRAVAEQIQRAVGGDLFEIKTVKPYPAEYRPATEVAKQEQDADARPELAVRVSGVDSYGVVLLGYPNWWGTIPMPLYTFLESYDFSGKTILPFCTNGGSGLGRSVSDIQKLCPKATVGEGLAIRTEHAKSASNDITAWLRKQGLAK
ncbi:flavodoxin [Treponema endosymbiont of Eucomonympha sp.]|uniref:flavodoxin n=1 Tax=Treponema endosymbiont of Eucomonympha sp. TaxID=1580831 RepID=UPI0007515E82|nr:flavodoxin [Treponema endosymbiont of Eucomonympha sp.]